MRCMATAGHRMTVLHGCTAVLSCRRTKAYGSSLIVGSLTPSLMLLSEAGQRGPGAPFNNTASTDEAAVIVIVISPRDGGRVLREHTQLAGRL